MVTQYNYYMNNFQNHPLRKEVEVVLADFTGSPVLALFEQHGWFDLLVQSGLVNLSLVKEFYSNFDRSRSSLLQFNT